jgi:hypothetical protein
VAYVVLVRGSLVLVGFALSIAACGRSVPRAAPREVAKVSPPAPLEPAPRVRESACRAEPATVYGQEPVLFEIEAQGSGELGVQLFDERGESVASGTVVAPGSFRPPPLPSGDFTLHAGSHQVTCQVTVNRELSRASPLAR